MVREGLRPESAFSVSADDRSFLVGEIKALVLTGDDEILRATALLDKTCHSCSWNDLLSLYRQLARFVREEKSGPPRTV